MEQVGCNKLRHCQRQKLFLLHLDNNLDLLVIVSYPYRFAGKGIWYYLPMC